MVNDFTVDARSNAIGQLFRRDNASDAYTVEPMSDRIGFSFEAASRTYMLRYSDAMLTTRATLQRAFNGSARDSSPDADDVFARNQFGADFDYVGWIYWRHYPAGATGNTAFTERRLIYGAPTEPRDLPPSGTAIYATLFEHGIANGYYQRGDYPGYGSSWNGTLTIDWATGVVTGMSNYSATGFGTGSSYQNGGLRVRAQLDRATGRITGQFAYVSSSSSGSVVGDYGGAIEGAMFGPQGIEIGLGMANGALVTALGRKQP